MSTLAEFTEYVQLYTVQCTLSQVVSNTDFGDQHDKNHAHRRICYLKPQSTPHAIDGFIIVPVRVW